MFAQQPITPARSALMSFLTMMYGYLEPGSIDAAFAYAIVLRGLGEKGTPGEGVFNDAQAVTPIRSPFEVDLIQKHMDRYAAHGRATFIVPAAVAPAALDDHKAPEDRILFFTTILVDIDNGDPEAKLAHAEKHLGPASMVVHSGGFTEEGKKKLHAYWRLTEPTDKIAMVAAARKLLALKIGADAAFGRCTQVIRLPGSVYGKNGVKALCDVLRVSHAEYEIEDLLTAIDEMPNMEGIFTKALYLCGRVSPSVYSTPKGLDFVAFKKAKGDLAHEKPDISLALNNDVVEGGDADHNRWTQFNRVAGLHIHQVRTGIINLELASELTLAWAELHMKPLWPQAKIDREWRALLDKDVREKGAFPGKAVPLGTPKIGAALVDDTANPNSADAKTIDAVRNLDGSFSEQQRLEAWAVDEWIKGDKPTRKFLVSGLVQAAKSHLLAAEGGAGKTFLLLDLAARIASHTPGRLQSWCGMPLADDAGGTVVMFTTEDDAEELHIRLADIIPDKDKLAALKKLVIVPTINIGGAFALVERDRAAGPAKIGSQWLGWLKQLEGVKDLRLVIIDTLNTTLHGEENSATVINEYMQAASAYVCGKFGAALIVTHHVRKPGSNTKIYTAEDMKNSIRGSTALIGAFRVALGVWHAPDYKGRLTAIRREPVPGQLYNFAVVKANNPEMAYGIRALLRQPNGLLVDITDKEQAMRSSALGEITAWAVHAVAYAAERGHPFTIKAAMKKPPNGRKHQLPAILRPMTENEVSDLLKGLVESKRLAQCNPKGRITYNHLDVPDGPLAKAMGPDGGAYRIDEGADFKAPAWEKEFAFHVVEGRIVEAGHERDRTAGGGPTAVQQPVPNPNPATGATGTTDTTCENVEPPVADDLTGRATDTTGTTALPDVPNNAMDTGT